MTNDTLTLESVAREAANAFTTDKRTSGETFTKLKDDAPGWVKDLVQAAHSDESGDLMFPDDHRYEFISDALDALANGTDDEDELEADPYSSDLLKWLGSHAWRFNGYADDALDNYGPHRDFMGIVSNAQLLERREVFRIVKGLVEDEITARNDDARENADEDSDDA